MSSAPSFLRHIKPGVRALSAYTLRHYQPRIKLNQNESPYDVPAELKRRLQEELAARPWNRYPPFVADSFIGAVAEAMAWPEDGILVANGSNELIQAVLAVVLCSPNNPTGGALSREEILRIHDASEALILLDQAYVEFGGYDARELLDGRPRIVILRTFSKAMALAGLRAGYLLADPVLVREVNKAKLPYNINFFTEAVAAGVLRHRELLASQVAEMRLQRDRIERELARLAGLRVFPSAANFVLFRVEARGIDHLGVFQRLLDEYGILIRDVSRYPMLDGCLRVNAGTPEETGEFLAAMSEILGGESR